MFLRRLVEYSHSPQVKMPPVMYTKTPVAWLIDLAPDGTFLGFVRMTGEGRRADRGKELFAPDCGRRTVGIKARLLCDNGSYILGLVAEGKKAPRAEQAHASFVELIQRCAEETGLDEVKAVVRFLGTLATSPPPIPEDLDPSQNITFRISDRIVVDMPEIEDWWASYIAGVSEESNQCVICGKRKPCLDRHPVGIKRIPGGQPAGMAMISANADAFESYGLSASLIAPTCRDCAERYAKSLNELLASESHSYRIGKTAFIFWTREEPKFNVLSFLTQPDEEQVKELVRSARTGKQQSAIDANAFYAAALSASGGRVVVRDWVETTVPNVQSNLARWFRRQGMVDAWGGEGRRLGVFPLVASLYRDARRDIVEEVSRLLIKSALTGSPIPDYLLYQAIKRMKADPNPVRNNREDSFTLYARIMLIRLVLNSHPDKEEDYMNKLDTENRDPAYLCGRLLAVLESIQRTAVPGAKATLIDRYYGSASSAPASVFGTLMRGAQAHLAKLRKEKEGAYVALQKRIEGICSELPERFPATLSMKQQALFALGYYHQRADDRASMRAHLEEKDETESGETTE